MNISNAFCRALYKVIYIKSFFPTKLINITLIQHKPRIIIQRKIFNSYIVNKLHDFASENVSEKDKVLYLNEH